LLGDGSYDSRNYEGFGYWNMVPPKIVNTVYSEAPSDEALGDFNGDGLAELAIGRIPARTAPVITTVYNKTVAFETPAMQNLNRGAVCAYDFPIGFDFQATCQLLHDELPPSVPRILVGRGDVNAQATLINEINTGRFIVNYSGHGTTGLWANGSFFGISNVPQLTNTNPTVFTMLTCLNGYFIGPNDGLSEALIKKQGGGAAAAWSSTGLTTPDIQLIMGLRFYEQMGQGSITRLGDLVRDAKTAIPFGADTRLSWALLGDPMMKIRP
ncbi:MAG: C25 family cysteine peptidase, partial [Pyrinomonadaceae bacterium]